jgi:hypothetical protein
MQKVLNAALVLFVLGTVPVAARADEKVRVGIFDARSVAIAYFRSDVHRKYLEGRVAEARQFREAGDHVKANLIERQMRDLQSEAHRQVFGVGPYTPLAERLKGLLEPVARRGGLKAVGPEVFFVADGVESVDVTEELLSALGADEKTRQVIDDMRRKVSDGSYRPEEFKGQ